MMSCARAQNQRSLVRSSTHVRLAIRQPKNHRAQRDEPFRQAGTDRKVISYPQGQASPNDAHNKVQASSKQPHPSTSTRLPALTPHPTLGEKPTFRPNPSTKQEAIERHLVSSRTSEPKRRPQQSASIIQASPSKHINSTSRSHSPPEVGAQHSD